MDDTVQFCIRGFISTLFLERTPRSTLFVKHLKNA